MNRLHAYWRIPYIETPKDEKNQKAGGNPFAEMAQSDDFRKFHIVWRGRYSFIVTLTGTALPTEFLKRLELRLEVLPHLLVVSLKMQLQM